MHCGDRGADRDPGRNNKNVAGRKKKKKKSKTADRKGGKPFPARMPRALIDLIRRAAEEGGQSLDDWVLDRLEKTAKRELKR